VSAHGAGAAAESSARLATLGLLVAGIAHELNTPLGAIHSNHDVLHRALDRLSGILADEQVDATELEEVRRVVRAIGEITRVNEMAVERMVQIVASLRSFGRLDGADTARVDLHEGLESTLVLLRHEMGDRVALERDYGALPPVQCRPHQINQLFLNLLLNAAQAIRERGSITIRTRTVGDQVSIEITDTGAGIAAENLARIFEPGFTTKGGRVGMGLGLPICRQIADAHHGRLTARSEPGRGTTFTLLLPIGAPAPGAEQTS
jgi:two-component system NtrC family sensor kinase